MLPYTPGSRREIPRWPTPEQCERLRSFLHQGEHWVFRLDWQRYLGGDDKVRRPIDALTSDNRAAAVAWLRQQQHALYRTLEGESQAPEGWLQSMELYRSLAR